MKYRKLGKTGYMVSEVGFGAWQIGGSHWGVVKDDESISALNEAISRGVNFIDTAANYGNGKSEEMISQVLKGRTEKVYVSTKIWGQTNNRLDPYSDSEEEFSERYLRNSTVERLKKL